MEESEKPLCKEHGYRKVMNWGSQLKQPTSLMHSYCLESPVTIILGVLIFYCWIPHVSVRLQKPCQLFYLCVWDVKEEA